MLTSITGNQRYCILEYADKTQVCRNCTTLLKWYQITSCRWSVSCGRDVRTGCDVTASRTKGISKSWSRHASN